jgi:hypothetical protein
MRKPSTVLGLDAYGLTLTGLRRLGSRSVHFSLQLKGRRLSSVVRFPPKRRDAEIRTTLTRQFKTLTKQFPEASLASRNEQKGSWTLDGQLPANRIHSLASRPEVTTLTIKSIEGRSAKHHPRTLGWRCVWGVVAIQVEGHRGSRIDIEDRFLLVKAYDAEDAINRLRREWERYAAPYLNPYGYLVRWQLVSIKDVYALADDDISENGTEVFSRIRSVKMKPEYRWLGIPANRKAKATSRATKASARGRQQA